ncbi:nuclear transport factor 2 family protein [Nocardioides islandensis]|uniref:Nuclear transport factor 2 family protein n=1 Tax=Nocardioides islandensis TaxID=433663 RepID=A0A930VA38_9ACTN|nr:nuclear transport factor 2 family protein [Nocardioides islandensis]MBF4762737.1 nuclear transport factor 2 family protein [Nocardioides islandensis]
MLTLRAPDPAPASSTPSRDVGAAFVTAVTTRDIDSLRSLLADELRFRMLLPSGPTADSGAGAAVDRITSWFADADEIEVLASTSAEVGGRVAVTYRLRVHRPGGGHLIEQHVMLDLADDGRITSIDLLCSGFRRIASEESGQAHEYDAGDLGCADGLAGAFRDNIGSIPVGHVLVVSTSDPAAKEDLPSLARLMGHAVRSIEATPDGRLLVSVERRR